MNPKANPYQPGDKHPAAESGRFSGTVENQTNTPKTESHRLLELVPTNEHGFHMVTEELGTEINRACQIINDWATKKGWNEDPLAPYDIPQEIKDRVALAFKNEQHMLFVTEISEGVEAMRVSKPGAEHMDDKVPELTGEAAELADTVIRIFHYCGKHGINLGEAIAKKHDFNTRRPYRHGKNC